MYDCLADGLGDGCRYGGFGDVVDHFGCLLARRNRSHAAVLNMGRVSSLLDIVIWVVLVF